MSNPSVKRSQKIFNKKTTTIQKCPFQTELLKNRLLLQKSFRQKIAALSMKEKESATSVSEPLKFGLLLNSTVVEKWQAACIRLLLKDGHHLQLYVLKIDATPRQNFFRKLLTYPYSRLAFRIWHRFVFRPDSKKTEDISKLLHPTQALHVQVEQQGFSSFFPAEAIQAIQSLQLDFIIRFGFNIIRGDILKAARWGVWSFHHDDEQKIRGGPPGFWEVFHKHTVNGVVLQQLTHALDKGMILDKAYFPVIHHSWKAQLDQIYSRSTYMPVRVARMLQSSQLQTAPSSSQAPVYKPPGNLQLLLYLIRMPWRRLAYHLRTLFFQEDWHIGLIHAPLKQVIEHPSQMLPAVQWLPRKERSSYLADPFLIEYDGDTLLFAEHFDYRSGKGKIVMAKQSDGFETFHDALPQAHHCSFPYIFVHEKELYCVPEQFASNRLDLYRWDKKAESFSFQHTLMDNIQAIDPVLFEQDGLWWLLFGTKDLPSGQLFAFYSPKLTGPYRPHQLNPVKTSVMESRNAGKPIVQDGSIIRFSQDAAKTYGHKVHIHSLKINPQSFKEETIGELQPNKKSPYNSGLHTINGTDHLTVIDGKRFNFTLAGFRHQLYLKLKLR